MKKSVTEQLQIITKLLEVLALSWILPCLFAITILFLAEFNDAESATLRNFSIRYDGVYTSGEYSIPSTNITLAHYLRFYENGMVFGMSFSGTPEQVAQLLSEEARSLGKPKAFYTQLAKGKYTTDGSSIQFKLSNRESKTTYEGTIRDNGLAIDFSKPKTRGKTSEIYQFVPVSILTVTQFSEAGISFVVPVGWKVQPSSRYARMREMLDRELRPYDRQVKYLTMLLSRDEKAGLLVSIVTSAKPVTIDKLHKEREQVYNSATRSGDVQAINELKDVSILGHPTLLEDVTRKSQGRGRSLKILVDKTIVEITLVVQDSKQFSAYQELFEEILKSLRLSL